MAWRLAALELIALMGGCGHVEDVDFPRSVTFDLICPGEGQEALNLWRGVQLWAELGVEVVIETQEIADVTVCFVAERPHGFAGYTNTRRGGPATIEILSGMRTDVIGPIFAHELAHALILDDIHLPEGEVGLLSPHVEGRAWSPDDLDFLAGYGLPLSDG